MSLRSAGPGFSSEAGLQLVGRFFKILQRGLDAVVEARAQHGDELADTFGPAPVADAVVASAHGDLRADADDMVAADPQPDGNKVFRRGAGVEVDAAQHAAARSVRGLRGAGAFLPPAST